MASRTFTDGPMVSASCRESVLELMDLVQLYMAMEREEDQKESLLLTNGVISTCDSMLRTYDAKRETTTETLPIDSVAFYYIYGSALLSLFYKAVSIYSVEISNVFSKLDDKDPLDAFIESVYPLSKYGVILVKTILEKCREAYTRSLSPGSFAPTDLERSESDPEAFVLLEYLEDIDSTRELYIGAILADLFINRRKFVFSELKNELLSIEASVKDKDILEGLNYRRSFFIKHGLKIIEAEASWVSKLADVDRSILEKRMEAVDFKDPDWSIIDHLDVSDADSFSDTDTCDCYSSSDEETEYFINEMLKENKDICLSPVAQSLGTSSLYLFIESLHNKP